jgi:hypothetical protein
MLKNVITIKLSYELLLVTDRYWYWISSRVILVAFVVAFYLLSILAPHFKASPFIQSSICSFTFFAEQDD